MRHLTRSLCMVITLGMGFALEGQAPSSEPQTAPTYFSEPSSAWWKPKGELHLESEQIPAVPNPEDPPVRRTRARLQMGWSGSGSWIDGEIAFRSAIGSDGNQFNRFRYDQQPSNGTWLQRASLRVKALGEHGYANLTLGLQGNPLLSQESYWDHDLSIAGGSLQTGFRNEASDVQEAGLRIIGGRVKTFPGQRADLAAGQVVLRMGIGSLEWTVHAGRWALHWDQGIHRFIPLPGHADLPRQEQSLDVVGVGLQNTGDWPWELKGVQHRNPDTKKTGGEAQLWLGPRNHPWYPQVGAILQRYAITGTFMPLNGDEWWFTQGAHGLRYIAALPLPGGVRITASHMIQTRDGATSSVTRSNLALTWTF